MPRFAFLAVAISFAAPASAQVEGSCAPPGASVAPCLVGSWIGANTIGERVRAMLEAMAPAGVNRSVMPDEFSRVIGMVIYSDGFFRAPPFNTAVTISDLEGDGTFSDTILDFNSLGDSGWLWTEGSNLNFCNSPGGGGIMGMGVRSSGGSASTTVDVPAGAPTFTPEITYTCSADLLTMVVRLPAPLGEVNHYFSRVPDSRFGEYLRAFEDGRYAVPEE